MGVGVYSSDFDGRGTTFLVDGPLGEDSDFLAYIKACKSDGVEPLGRDDWSQQEYNDANLFFIESVESALGQLGFDLEKRKGFDAPSSEFDRHITQIGENSLIAVGWRSWETDFVVAIGPSRSATQSLDFDDAEAVVEIGRDRESFGEDYDVLVSMVDDYVRLWLMQDGIKCRYKTSGYTTEAYAQPADWLAQLEALKTEVAALTEKLSQDREVALAGLSSDERVKVLKTVLTAGRMGHTQLAVPVVDMTQNALNLYRPADADGGALEIVATLAMPPEISGFVASLAKDAIVALPRTAMTESWFKARQQRNEPLLVSAEEMAKAMETDIEIDVGPEQDTEPTWLTLVAAPEPAPAATM